MGNALYKFDSEGNVQELLPFEFTLTPEVLDALADVEHKNKKIFANLPERLKDYNGPAWLVFDLDKLEGKILEKPKNNESFLDLNAVLEFYSR